MRTIKNILVGCYIMLIGSCQSSKMVTVWNSPNRILSSSPKIMVVGIAKSEDESIRKAVEDHLTASLAELGYSAVSSLKIYGPKGLSDLGEEATYLKLCNDGIDAVLTVALLANPHKALNSKYAFFVGNSAYYYERMWNYGKLQADISGYGVAAGKNYVWESILFDLSMLEPICVIQTKSLRRDKVSNSDNLNSIIRRMKKIKALVKQKKRPSKAF